MFQNRASTARLLARFLSKMPPPHYTFSWIFNEWYIISLAKNGNIRILIHTHLYIYVCYAVIGSDYERYCCSYRIPNIFNARRSGTRERTYASPQHPSYQAILILLKLFVAVIVKSEFERPYFSFRLAMCAGTGWTGAFLVDLAQKARAKPARTKSTMYGDGHLIWTEMRRHIVTYVNHTNW